MAVDYERISDDKIVMCRTSAWGISKCHIAWEIPNFQQVLTSYNNKCLKTKDLSPVEGEDTVWHLVLAVDMDTLREEEMLSECQMTGKRVGLKLMLDKKSDSCSGYNVLYRMGLINKDGHESHVKSPPEHIFKEKEEWGFHGLVHSNDLIDQSKGLVPKGKLITFCEMTITKWYENLPKEPILSKQMKEDMERLVRTGKYSDAVVMTTDAQFPVHRAVLEARTEHFEFQPLENGLVGVDLSEFDRRTIWDLLLFIYAGKTENVDRTSGDLIALASKYQLKDLEDLCVKALYKKLKVKNSSIILEKADEMGRKDLNDEVLKYMMGCPLVKSLTDWDAFSKSNYDMALDTLIKVTNAPQIKDDLM